METTLPKVIFIFFQKFACMGAQFLGHVYLFVTSWTVVCQAALSLGFSRQEYWSGLPFPSPGNLPDPGIEPVSPTPPLLAGRFFTTEPPGKFKHLYIVEKRPNCFAFKILALTSISPIYI